MASDTKPASAPQPEPTVATAAPAAAPAAAAPEPILQLREACERIGETDRRVELLAAFYADEEAEGNLTGALIDYRTRLAAFAQRPA